MSCGTRTLKICSIILSFLCCVFGAFTIIAGAYTLEYYNHSEVIRIPCILSIVFGSLLLLSTLLGCSAALRENVRLTWTYAGILMLLLIGQTTIMFMQPVHFDRLAKEIVNNAWQRQFQGYNNMALYEIQYRCCGKTNSTDYTDSGLKIPSSCYPNQSIKINNQYKVGCTEVFVKVYEMGTKLERISDWTLFGIEGMAILVAGMLAIALQNAQRRRLYS